MQEKVSRQNEAKDSAMVAREAKGHGVRLEDLDLAKAKVPLMPKENNDKLPYFLRVRRCLHFWVQLKAPKEVLSLIRNGVGHDWPVQTWPFLSQKPQHRSKAEVMAALLVMKEYQEVWAVRKISPSRHIQTRHLVPWFVLTKTEPSGKIKTRLIADCREITNIWKQGVSD